MNDMISDESLRALLRAGVAWLYETEQPNGAEVSHFGASVRANNRFVQFMPEGGRPEGSRGPVIVVNTRDGDEVGLRAGEIDGVVDVLHELGVQVSETWNGAPGCETGSIQLVNPAHPSLLAAVENGHESWRARREVPPSGYVAPDYVAPDFTEVHRLEADRLRSAVVVADTQAEHARKELAAARERINALEDQVRTLALERVEAVMERVWNIDHAPYLQRRVIVDALADAGLLADVEPLGVSPRD